MKHFLGYGLMLAILGISTPIHAVLIRNGGIVYDTATDLSWVQQPTPIGFLGNGGLPNGIFDGNMNYGTALQYVSTLTVDGIGGWRLPQVNTSASSPSNCIYSYNGSSDCGYNVNSSHSELANLFAEMGNLSLLDTSGNTRPPNTASFFNGVINSAPFGTLYNSFYDNLNRLEFWGVYFESSSNPSSIPYFTFDVIDGRQIAQSGCCGDPHFLVWGVQSGNVSNASIGVPEPTTILLVSSGLIIVRSTTRKKERVGRVRRVGNG